VADLGPLAVAAFLATLPSLAVFALIQRRITAACSPGR
jgi:multiple sugar transport system permease protein